MGIFGLSKLIHAQPDLSCRHSGVYCNDLLDLDQLVHRLRRRRPRRPRLPARRFHRLQEMQPSEYEIQREVETLRDIRRRSSAQGGILDPDLPAVSSDSGSSTGYWEDSSSSSHGDDSDGGSVGGDDPFSPF